MFLEILFIMKLFAQTKHLHLLILSRSWNELLDIMYEIIYSPKVDFTPK